MKWLLVVFMFLPIIGLSGCGGGTEESSSTYEQPAEAITPESAPTEPPIPDVVIDSRESAMDAANHSDLRIRWKAVGYIKEQSDTAFIDLKQLLNSDHEDVVCAAVNGLRATGPQDEVIRLLQEILKHPRVAVQTEAVINLGEIGPAAAGALPAIEPLLEAEDARLREKAREARDKITAQ